MKLKTRMSSSAAAARPVASLRGGYPKPCLTVLADASAMSLDQSPGRPCAVGRHPDPAPVEDCYAGLVWTAANAAKLGIDNDRVAVAGANAGGGLASGVALMARDGQGPKLAGQMGRDLVGPGPRARRVFATNTGAVNHQLS